jgi:hypothetical protein
MSDRLGATRDGGALQLSILGAVSAVQSGDVDRAVTLLRAAESQS